MKLFERTLVKVRKLSEQFLTKQCSTTTKKSKLTKEEFEDKFNFYRTKYNLTWDYDCDLTSISDLIVFSPREEEALKIDVSDAAVS